MGISKKIASQSASILRSFWRMNESGIILITIAYAIFVWLINPVFFSGINLSNILRQTGFVLIPALGMTMVLISGGINISVGSVLGVAGLVTGFCLADFQLPIMLGILMGLIAGMLLGLGSGFLIVRFSIPPIIATLGMMYVAKGLALVMTDGIARYPMPDAFNALEQGEALGMPNIIPLYLILCIIFSFILNHTTFGRSVYAVGGNQATAKLSGINVKKVQMLVYMLSGLMAGVAGVMLCSRLGSAQPAAGEGQEMHVIASCIIGGTSPSGGKGSILGTLIGSIFMSMLTNSMTLMKVNVNWQKMVLGLVLVFAVIMDRYKQTQSQKVSIRLG